MTLQILSFVKLSDKQIDLIHQSYPHCQCRCIRPTEADNFLSNVDILLGYDAQMNMEKYLPQMPRLQWIHTYSAGVEKLLSNETFSQSDILLTNARHPRHPHGRACPGDNACVQSVPHRGMGESKSTYVEAPDRAG